MGPRSPVRPPRGSPFLVLAARPGQILPLPALLVAKNGQQALEVLATGGAVRHVREELGVAIRQLGGGVAATDGIAVLVEDGERGVASGIVIRQAEESPKIKL